ncbi:lipid droplet-associated hydrolase-like isoform X2 [Acropora palmata]|uniref:lipid droplet-associated hydrolase-like isoform X2 n=1 Tax=Acropora palmata TaxID=6131 RepID=UPI003DA1C302
MVDSLACSLVKEVVFVNGLPTVISKILPRCRIHKFVIVVIPGNPGLVEFYDVFVTSLFNSLKGQWPIYAISHAGHSPTTEYPVNPFPKPSIDKATAVKSFFPLTLNEQIVHKNEFLKSHIPPHSKIILIGHSIGAYIILNILKTCDRAADITKAILLFPTFERMAVSPSGRYVTPAVRYFKWFAVSAVAVFSVLPESVRRFLINWWLSDRKNLIIGSVESVLKLLTPQSIIGVVTMADNEMKEVVNRDDVVIEKNLDKFIFYYGVIDNWTPVSYYEDIRKRFPDGEIYLCQKNFQHAFVLESSHEVAEMVSSWIQKETV